MQKNIIIFILLLGCTREVRHFNEPLKTNRFLQYDTESVYLYIPSTLGTPRKIISMRPFFKGSEQLVKLKWTKQGLSVYSSDEDNRFDFSRNQKPVFTIPGEYMDFKCKPNQTGECFEEDTSLNWSERPYFFPDLSKIDFKGSLNILDLSLDDDGCFIEKNTNVTDYVIERGVINIELEKEYVISKSGPCITKYLYRQGLDTSDLSFKTTFFYSLVRLKDLASADYEPRPYSLDEQSKFGFFKNTQNIYDENYYHKIENVFLNRWNPKRKKVTYYLSDSFDEKGQEVFKEATFKAIEDINKVLKKANVSFELELLPPAGKKSGDLRYNLINLITDPLENGLLGYGPSISNPLTGEILSASVNMYSGMLRRMVPTIYKKMEKLSREESRLKKLINPALVRSLDLIRRWPRRDVTRDLNLSNPPEGISSARMDPRISLSPDFYSKENRFNQDTQIIEKDSYLENLDFLAKNNAYPSEFYLNGGRGKSYIVGVKEFKEVWNPDNTLKKWDELTKSQKEKITQMAMPHAYRTTLIHELGHNLGLRHNFKGSMDKNNFYQKSDFESSPDGSKYLFGIKISNSPTFSSIMDYGYSELNELPIFGKYDIAALRFAYAGEVELENGEIKKLDEKGLFGEPLKKYEFCTDEGVGSSALCDRFDEGTTYTEIMRHYGKKYEDFYETRNFRNNREIFNLLDNGDYFLARRAEFARVRRIFETWEVLANQEIVNQNKKDATIKEQRLVIQKKLEDCKQKNDRICNMVLDIDNATKNAGKFFLNILKMPNHECLISIDGKERVIPLDYFHRALALDLAPKSCFDPIIPENLREAGKTIKILAERGKYLKDLQEYNPKFRYSSDLAAKGIWIDKILAIQYLVGRNLHLNRYQDPQLSFLDHPTLGPEIEKFIDDLILQRPLDNPIPFKDKRGNIVKDNSGFTKMVLSGENNPIIPQQISISLIYFLNLPLNSYFYLSTVLLNSMINVLSTADPSLFKKGQAYMNHLGVKKVDGHIDLDPKKYSPETTLSDGKKYAGSPSFDLAAKLILDLNYFNFLESFKSLNENIELSDPPVTTLKLNKLLRKIYYFKMNPYLDISMRGLTWQEPVLDFYRESLGAKKKSLEVSVDVLDEIIKSFEKDRVGEEYFQEVFKNESSELKLASRALYLKDNLTKDELIKTREFLLSAYSPPPDFLFLDIYNLEKGDILKLIELTDGKVRAEMEDLLKGLKAF